MQSDKGVLTVEVLNAVEVPRDRFKKSDPYVVIYFRGIKNKTSHKKSEINPVWNEKLSFDLKGIKINSYDSLEVVLKDHETLGSNKLLAKGVVPLGQLSKIETLQCQVDLFDSSLNKLESTKLFLNIELKAPESRNNNTKESNAVSENSDDSGFLNDSSLSSNTSNDSSSSNKNAKINIRHKNQSSRLNKIQDFQIRVKIIEARQLDGNNIHPLCCIKCSKQSKYTKTVRSTNNPYWDEVFFFNFRCAPSELFDELVEFQIFNSLKYRSDPLIGSFKIDIGYIYDEPNHSINRRWLLLTDTGDQLSTCKGYLKVSVNVLGPGDEIPNNVDHCMDDDDIENNLLKPAGIMLRPATLVMKVYRAEDLPRMDSNIMQKTLNFITSNENKKELVDPYAIFSFAGKKVQTKTIYNCASPEWNQELKIEIKFPSLCDKIGLIIKDWDRSTKDDLISTLFINLQDISDSSEDGYLPTFGPCFFNLYGSPREYSELPTILDELNNGKSEGVAYRGRVFIEMKTILGELPDESVCDIKPTDVLLIEPFLRQQKYKLHAVFLDATMISLIDKPIEFEVSIGNYGNKLDENLAPSSSTTAPANALFDGCSYYFLPWGDIKPCVQITSFWEDISFRIEAANQINKLRQLIEKCIQLMKSRVETLSGDIDQNSPEIKDLAKTIIKMIDDIKTKASIPLPAPIEGKHHPNDLDRLLMKCRVQYLSNLIVKCEKIPRIQFKFVLEELENFCDGLKKLENEPQNSIPDVIIWMLCGNERTAYYRIPAKDIFYSSKPDAKGLLCGSLQTVSLKWPGKVAEEKSKKDVIPAQIRVKLWFGLERDEKNWVESHTDESRDGAITIFAETYENQQFSILSRSWSLDVSSRPSFSDASGKIALPKEKFDLPKGWEWSSDWKLAPDISSLFEKDDGHSQYMEEVYEQQYRMIPGANWTPGDENKTPYGWTDYKGECSMNKNRIQPPPNWKWKMNDEWSFDINRAVDNEGWEYCIDPSMGGWSPSEKVYHLLKRRRWIRNRILTKLNEKNTSQQFTAIGNMSLLLVDESKKKEMEEACGWEYARGFGFKFHVKERQTDIVRRRRWHRQMKPINANDYSSALFRFKQLESTKQNEKSKDETREVINMNAPRLFIKYQKAHRFQLRAYVYQARSLLAGDSDTSLSDPYCQITFINQSARTEIFKRNLSPTWDQTLIFESVNVYGDLAEIKNDPPKLLIELFDHDPYGRSDFLGRCYTTPKIKADKTEGTFLEWYQIKKDGQNAGEVLAAFDLFHIDGDAKNQLPIEPPKTSFIYRVPPGIRPELQRTIIEVLCWGVRNMKSFQLSNIGCPQVVFECGGLKIESDVLKNAKINANFQNPVLYFDIMLPKEELYTPPMNIKVLDHRHFGRKPIVGVHVIQSISKYRVDRSNLEKIFSHSESITSRNNDFVIELEIPNKSKAVVEEDIDWWSKFYASLDDRSRCGTYLTKGYEKITIFPDELENQKKFEKFADFCETFVLQRGKTINEEENVEIGEFKGMFKVYPVLGNGEDIRNSLIYKNIQPLNKEECIIRVYVIRGIDLQPKDSSGKSDPYIQIINGKTKIDSRDEYIPNTNNPEFGKMFELKALLPAQKDLCIRIKDYDLVSSDELIGETWIDLENRILTKYRATCGLPLVYNIAGPNKWRDSLKPSQILTNICKIRNLEFIPPMAYDLKLTVGKETLHLNECEKGVVPNPYAGPKEERLCLHALHKLNLVPEHVETRKLYNPMQPGIEQGRLQMWVDIYPLSQGNPGPAFDITPRKPKKYVLRCIIWNTKDVPFDEVSITGEKMSDIYVKGWVQGLDSDKQKTDIHYRSMDGDGYFNWRFIFPFEYSPAEQLITIKKKEHVWSLDETETKIPPKLNLQIWDNDKFSADDFIGQISLDLNNMIKPVKSFENCNLDQLNAGNDQNKTDRKQISLFEQRRMKGWWPCSGKGSDNIQKIAGKLEMELELLTEEEANQRAAGKGREAPNENPKLEEPNRPDTSFLWINSPLRTFKYIIWRRCKWGFITFLFLLFLVIFLLLMFYTMPSAIWSNVVFRHLP